MDFVHNTLEEGRSFRVLVVVDLFSRQLVCLEPAISFTGRSVAECLERAAGGQDFDAWAFEKGVALDFIRPGKPTENGFCESLNGRFRDECLNAQVFLSIEDAKKKISKWKTEYNTARPHSALGNLSPSEYLRRWKSKTLANYEFLDLE